VFQRWKEYKGRRAQLFGSLIALACKWEQPLMEDAWAAWREYTVESKRIKVKDLESGNAWLAAVVMHLLYGLNTSSQCLATELRRPKRLQQVAAAGNHADLNNCSLEHAWLACTHDSVERRCSEVTALLHIY